MLSKELHINSGALRERHHALYEELYHTCPTVVSVPAMLLWSPTYAVGPGGIGMMSKLPLRIHVGIEPTSDDGVVFGPTRYYIPERDEFETWDSTRISPLFLQVLESVAKNYHLKGGARIWCISEIPWYRGLNVDPIYGAAAGAAWLLHVGAVSAQEIKEFVSLPTDKLAGSAAFEKVFRLGWKLDSIVANWLSDGHFVFGSLIDAQQPVMFFRERDPFLFDHYRDFGIDHPSSFFNAPDSLFYRGTRMSELFPFDRNLTWPLDVGLVFTGEEGDSRFVYQTRGAHKAKLDEAATFAMQSLKNVMPETFRRTPRFLEMAQGNAGQSPGMRLFQVYRENSVAHSMTVFKTMHDLLLYGAAPHVLRDFLQAQNLCQHFLRILGLSPLPISRAATIIRSIGHRHTEAGVSNRLIGPGGHGCLMVVGPLNSLGNVLAEALPHIEKETGKAAHGHWASWRDGNTASEGARVEQYVEGGMYSALTARESITVREWNGHGRSPTVLYTAQKWESTRAQFDLVLDSIRGKIFVRGELLTSEQIHSAKQTIELFRHIFTKGVEELPARELSESCYRSDRNQMESKIVRPLVGAVHEKTGKKLGLDVHGGLGSQYVVRFAPHQKVRIGFVEKI